MEQDYNKMTDESLALLAQKGDSEAEEFLIRKYKGVVRGKARIYFIAGAEAEDVIQEGMIGIFKAIKSYDKNRNASFHTFAQLCINRQIVSAIKAASRRKHSPLNSSVSLNKPVVGEENEEGTLGETLSSEVHADPETMLVYKEIIDYIMHNEGGMFSDFELKVWNERMKGKTYTQIAEELNKSPKAIDNAMQRTKKKIVAYMYE